MVKLQLPAIDDRNQGITSILKAAVRMRDGSVGLMLKQQPRPRLRWFGWSGGNLSNVKGVGIGVLECRIDFGPTFG